MKTRHLPLYSAALPGAFFGYPNVASAAPKQTGAGLPPPPDAMTHILEQISTALELVGIGVIVIGALAAVFLLIRNWRRFSDESERYKTFRANLGRSILLGLEFLVAADIIGTVAAVPTFESLGLLAIVILIRTFLSFSLETEIQGRFPWREAELELKKKERSV